MKERMQDVNKMDKIDNEIFLKYLKVFHDLEELKQYINVFYMVVMLTKEDDPERIEKINRYMGYVREKLKHVRESFIEFRKEFLNDEKVGEDER